jgi:hypothetical protein
MDYKGRIIIVTCMVVRVTKISGSRSADQFIGTSVTRCLLIALNTALPLIYTIYSSPLHTQ